MNDHLPAIISAIEYIENHIKDNLNMGDVACHVGFSKYHFTRVFKDITGHNPYDYYRGRKVTEAINYMQELNCKIIDAAFEFGFNSPEVFTRSCLTAFGESPSQIKKSIQSNLFKGYQQLDASKLQLFNKYQHITTEIDSLPPLVLKGHVYSDNNFYSHIDFNLPIINQLIKPDELLYFLHWQSKDDHNLYHHLIGTCVTVDDMGDEDNFSSYVYKQVPGRDYLIFPLMKDGKELDLMKDYIYEYYLPQNEFITKTIYHVEAIRFDFNRSPSSSMLFIPANKKKRRSH